MFKAVLRWMGAGLLLMFSPLSLADTEGSLDTIPNHPLLNSDFMVTLGVYYPRSTTTAALAPSGGGTGVVVNFEDALDLERRSVVPNFGMTWRASERWRVDVQYFEVSRDATRTLTSEIEWGDYTFPVGSTTDSTFDFADLRVAAAYAFFRRPDKELGAGLGVHVSGIKGEIASSGIGAEQADITAPLPVVNLYAMFALTDKWAMATRADWLSLEYGDYSGDVRNLETNFIYQPHRNIGVGLGLRSMLINVDMDKPEWRGLARVSFQGPTAFVLMSF